MTNRDKCAVFGSFASLIKRAYSRLPIGRVSGLVHRKVLSRNRIKLSEEQYALFEFLEETDRHVFVTGKAGTGKSILLKFFVKNTRKRVVIVAPTGIAALNIGGQTIHSLFRLPIGVVDSHKLSIDNSTKQLLKHVDIVVIDEISMVRVDVMDGIDHVLRLAKSNNKPFGGAQIIAFGDIYQLPPVIESTTIRTFLIKRYGGVHFFDAPALRTGLHVKELQSVFRQKHHEFKTILDAIRIGNRDNWIFTGLSSRIFPADHALPQGTVTLTTTKKVAQELNTKYLSKLHTKTQSYDAIVTGELSDNSFPTVDKLTLKIGAQVIFMKNDPHQRWVNGTTGVIKSLSIQSVRVSCGKKTFAVTPVTWEKTDYVYDQNLNKFEQIVTGTFTQLPLKPAWAITIHKSQGCTYDKVAIAMGTGAFAHGQTYVALSRCKSLAGLYLLQPLRAQDIIVDPKVHTFMKQHMLKLQS